ncbi:MAG: extracellular solute-binding protein family 1 [Paenibacillaceae bacterium]|jgi:multiple sugar transport system substrate-binding protein|nr:extracellular solute-binding protein family 1 [Paenibacillaceae bacterium]
MWKKSGFMGVAATLVMALALAGCGSSSDNSSEGADNGTGKTEKPPEPVTLIMYQIGSGIEDNEFNEIIANPVKQKYPYITVELQRIPQGETLESMVGAKQFPDLVFAGILDINRLKDLGLITDLNPFIKKYKYDVKKLQPDTTAMVAKYATDKGEMYAMPFTLGYPIMYYNRDLFDKFAVSYPKDGMSWEDAIALARRVTRQSDGVQYQGMDVGVAFARPSLSMLQEKYDAKREKALLTTPSWVRVMGYYKEWRTISGNEKPGTIKMFQDGQLAMKIDFNGALAQFEDMAKQGKALNWDMVTQPTFKEQPLVVDTPLQILLMAGTSKHQDEVFKVFEVVTEMESQQILSKNARPPVLTDKSLEKIYGENFVSLKGKNIAAPFKYKHMPINVSTQYDAIVNKYINQASANVLKGTDINTALREAEEAANKEIASQQGQ